MWFDPIDRPRGSDILWGLLETTWVVEDGPESKRRPSASVVLDQLEKNVDHWEKSITPKQWQERVGTPSIRANVVVCFMSLPQCQTLMKQTVEQRSIVNDVRIDYPVADAMH